MNMWATLIENLPLKHRQTRQHIPPFLISPNLENVIAANQKRAAETRERNYRANLDILRKVTEGRRTWTIGSIRDHFPCCEDGVRRFHKRLLDEGHLVKIEGDGEVHVNLWSWK